MILLLFLSLRNLESPEALLAMEPYMPMNSYMMHVCNPKTYVELAGHHEWDITMDEEYNSLIENQTWDLVMLPYNCKLIRLKWVY